MKKKLMFTDNHNVCGLGFLFQVYNIESVNWVQFAITTLGVEGSRRFLLLPLNNGKRFFLLQAGLFQEVSFCLSTAVKLLISCRFTSKTTGQARTKEQEILILLWKTSMDWNCSYCFCKCAEHGPNKSLPVQSQISKPKWCVGDFLALIGGFCKVTLVVAFGFLPQNFEVVGI